MNWIDQLNINLFLIINLLTHQLSTFMDKNQIPHKLFLDIKGDSEPTIIESVCVNCFENGETIILMTKIPFFRELIVTSFRCEHCGFRNNEVQFGGDLPDYGINILFRAMKPEDLNREVIKSEHAKIYIEELELEIPRSTKAEITTIQGLLMRVSEQLTSDQEERLQKNPQQHAQIAVFLQKLLSYQNGEKFPLTIKVTDPSGNSMIKNPYAPKQDKNMQITSIPRTVEELEAMGYNIENAKQQLKSIEDKKMGHKLNFTKPFEESQFMKYEPVIFDTPCHSCSMPGQMKMCQTSVPYFTDLVIMSFACDYCGAHTTETKNSGEVSENALVITLNASSDEDLKRDLFKSETCSVNLPQLELELDYGTLGGVFTTVEGLIQKIQDHLHERNPFADSDSVFYARMKILLDELAVIRNGGKNFTMILTDPLAHSFLQNPNHPGEDPNVTRQFRPRTEDENQTLGLNDIKVENYQTSSEGPGSGMKKKQAISEISEISESQIQKKMPQ